MSSARPKEILKSEKESGLGTCFCSFLNADRYSPYSLLPLFLSFFLSFSLLLVPPSYRWYGSRNKFGTKNEVMELLWSENLPEFSIDFFSPQTPFFRIGTIREKGTKCLGKKLETSLSPPREGGAIETGGRQAEGPLGDPSARVFEMFLIVSQSGN